MDRSWMLKDRRSRDYENGVEQFLNFAAIHATNFESIRCPCMVCGNFRSQLIPEIRNHLFVNGIDKSYRTWIWHGEPVTSEASQRVNTRDFSYHEVNSSPLQDAQDAVEMVEAAFNDCTTDPREFKKLIEDAEKPLYPGCAKTKLATLVRFYKFKASNALTNKAFTEFLTIVGEILPENHQLPSSTYEATKTMAALGMEYEKIHACPNDCILYRKEFKDATSCPTCNTSRWKLKKNSTEPRPGVPAKVLWYFPPIPRFQKMYQSVETSKHLTWHAEQRESDGQLRHPADSPSWKLIDHQWPDFASEPRNLWLALSADGINPHSSMSSRYSCWPVILVTYNLPPWLCMKRKFMMLTLLISGPHQPGNDIDVFLAPLIEDLKLLWEEGVEAFDAYKNQHFRLKAVLLWTINDFPALGNLSGSTVKGYYACPICCERTCSRRLKHGKKNIYQGHRKYLPRYHPYRKLKKAFDGEQEFGEPPVPLTGGEVLREVEGIKTIWGKTSKKKSSKVTATKCWKKKSIFFMLEYWMYLHIRHCLDLMHIEKNVLDSIIGTLLQMQGKTKDGINARLDLIEMGLRLELAPQIGEKRTYLPPACYTLSREEKIRFCKTLSELKVPDGYSSNLRNNVSMEDLKIYGLKSHDNHVLMQQLLPVAIRSVLPKEVRYALTRLCFFFTAICSKVVDVSKLDEIQRELVITLCLLEKYFPPSFFDIMVHLTVHLVREVRLCGPVHFRWMYPFERFMKVLKGYVRNRNRPEGCIAERYIAEEAVEFCAEYLSEVEAIGVPISKNMTADDIIGRPLPGGEVTAIDRELWEQAHLYVLENTSDVQPYIEEHMDWLKTQNPRHSKNQRWLKLEHNRTFVYWLREKIAEELSAQQNISDNLKWIAQGPSLDVIKYPGYVINGCRYHTKDRDHSRVNQNSGVSLVATTMQVAGCKDKNPVYADMNFYGVITEIWQLDYHLLKIPVFKCDWVDNKGVKVDELGFTLVELGRIGHKSDSFILASQAKQVFYVEDQLDSRWSIVLEPPQHRYPCNVDDDVNDCFAQPQALPAVESFGDNDDLGLPYVRGDCEGTWINN